MPDSQEDERVSKRVSLGAIGWKSYDQDCSGCLGMGITGMQRMKPDKNRRAFLAAQDC
jgi:hypothetical protein